MVANINTDEQNRSRERLCRWARLQGGDPHDPRFWYSISSDQVHTPMVLI
jgi:hypothetical protein